MRFKEYVDMFSKVMAETLSLHLPLDKASEQEPGFSVPYC